MEEIFHISGIEDEQQETEVEALWEKPANDIINGIGNNGLIKPARAIWELVQNGRDIAKDEGTNLSFMRCEDEFVFAHDGQPFTNKTMTALILQMSSKQNQSNVQAGQYGTGFLTTHKFGFKFLLSGPIEVKHGEGVYYNFSDFELEEYGLPRMISRKIQNAGFINFNSPDLTFEKSIQIMREIGPQKIKGIETIDVFDMYIIDYFFEGLNVRAQ